MLLHPHKNMKNSTISDVLLQHIFTMKSCCTTVKDFFSMRIYQRFKDFIIVKNKKPFHTFRLFIRTQIKVCGRIARRAQGVPARNAFRPPLDFRLV